MLPATLPAALQRLRSGTAGSICRRGSGCDRTQAAALCRSRLAFSAPPSLAALTASALSPAHQPSQENEAAEVQKRLPAFVDALVAVGADLPALSSALRKPLRALWVSQQSALWADFPSALPDMEFTPLVLVSASAPLQWAGARRAAGGSGWAYVPGAGDDEESWARGAGCSLPQIPPWPAAPLSPVPFYARPPDLQPLNRLPRLR